MSNKSVFIVTQIGWEYNDEVYYQSGEGAGYPQKAFGKLEDAQKYCGEQNLRELKQLAGGGGHYGIGEYLGYDGPNDKLRKFLEDKGIACDDYEIDLSGLSDKELLKAADLGGVYFYEIIELVEE